MRPCAAPGEDEDGEAELADLFEAGRATVESFPAGGWVDLRLLRYRPD